jgi:hypothetical protein
MEDLGRFIPIILAILYFLFGRSKENKQTPKGTAKPAKRKAPNQNTTSLEDILRELRGETTVATTQKEVKEEVETFTPHTAKKPRKTSKIDIVDHQYDFVPEYEHHADTGPKLAVIRQKINDAQGAHEFDLRQAVIAQAILTRPEY